MIHILPYTTALGVTIIAFHLACLWKSATAMHHEEQGTNWPRGEQ